MKRLILIAPLFLMACKEEAKKNLSDVPLTNISAPAELVPDPTPSPSPSPSQAQEEYTALRVNPTQTSYLPNGAYTAYNEPYCVLGDCSYQSEPETCAAVNRFPGDFEVYADSSATF